MNRLDRIDLLFKELEDRILVLDGAMGTSIQALHLLASDFGGTDLEGCNENLVLSKPQVITQIHESFLEVGADIIETNTFGATSLVLSEYKLETLAFDINCKAAQLARNCVQKYSTSTKPRFVAGSMGPTTKAISVTGGITFEDLSRHYYEQANGLHTGGVDFFLLETCQDTRNVKAGLLGIMKLFEEGAQKIPIAVSGTIEPTGSMLAGQSIDAFFASLAHLDLLYLGLNCATGPEFMTDHLRSLSKLAQFHVACVPNAGLPDENGNYLETPQMMRGVVERFLQEGWVNLIGGCCGTTPSHIGEFAKIAQKYSPRRLNKKSFSFLSGIDYLEIEEDRRPSLVGERTNSIGSRKFKALIANNEFEASAEMARTQIKNGAQIIDICLANPDRNEFEDMKHFLESAIRIIRAPMMIDSTDSKVIEMALTYSQGKSIINSINLEDGEERFEKVVPLAKTFGAALVVGTIDEDPQQGMAVTKERKLEVAKRSFQLLTEKYEVRQEDIYWDLLVFPCATGDAQYIGSAVETIEGLKLVKEEFPQTKTILGVSNVSFGLPPAGREILNSVFLYHCVQAGLDLAIVNTEQLKRYPSIPEEEKRLAENLLWNRGKDPIAQFAAFYRIRKQAPKKEGPKLPLEERLARYVVEGTKEGLIEDLEEALKTKRPLEIINGPLMTGMDEVGRLFAKNELIVAEVLQSAEVMKAAVSYLERFMEKKETAIRGKVVLATVKGDVHDIGKNLVEIILSNNGFQVLNLGIKVPPEQLIAAVREHCPQIIGLSGLLVKSAQQMVITADDLSKAGLAVPMLVGGAALTRNFVDKKIARAYVGTVAYAKDAMNGLELAKIMVDPSKFDQLKKELAANRKTLDEGHPELSPVQVEKTRSQIQPLTNPPSPPDYECHVLNNTPLEHIWSYMNLRMLLGRHLGISNSLIRLVENQDYSNLDKTEEGRKVLNIWKTVDEIKAQCLQDHLLIPKAVYQFFACQSEYETLHILSKEPSRSLVHLSFPRQKKSPFLCISDYVGSKSGQKDNLCLFVVTTGHKVRESAYLLKEEGAYLKSHILSALALESAEAYAEWLHAKIRGMWGIGDPPTLTMMERFQAHYTGKRYSFGYPACPDLEGQKVLFDLLSPQEIGVELTEGFMMEPEASVSAIVIHHSQATYFSV